ncbi:hypothetical protein D3C87_2160420 [compost metagenome]
MHSRRVLQGTVATEKLAAVARQGAVRTRHGEKGGAPGTVAAVKVIRHHAAAVRNAGRMGHDVQRR